MAGAGRRLCRSAAGEPDRGAQRSGECDHLLDRSEFGNAPCGVSQCRGPRPPPATARSALTATARTAPTRNLEPANPARYLGITAARAPQKAAPNASARPEDQITPYSRNRVRA